MSKSLAFPSQSPHLKIKTSFNYMTIVAGIPAKLFNTLSEGGSVGEILNKWVISRTAAGLMLPLKDSRMASDNGEVWLHAHFGIKWSEVMKYTEWDKLVAGQKLMSFCERHKAKIVYTIQHEKFG